MGKFYTHSLTKLTRQEMIKELKKERGMNEPPKKRDIVKDVFSANSYMKGKKLSTQGSITKRSDTMIVLESKRERPYPMNPKKYLGKRPTMGLIDGSDMLHGIGPDDTKRQFIKSMREKLANQILKEAEVAGSHESETIPKSTSSSSHTLESSLESEKSYILEDASLLDADPLMRFQDEVMSGYPHGLPVHFRRTRGSFLRRQRAIDVDRYGLETSFHPEDGLFETSHEDGFSGVGASSSRSCRRSSEDLTDNSSTPNPDSDTLTPLGNPLDRRLDDRQTRMQKLFKRQRETRNVEFSPDDSDRIILTWLYSQDRTSEDSGKLQMQAIIDRN